MLKFSRNNHAGFSLLEVMLCVGVLSAGIVAIMQSFLFCARVADFSGELSRAVFFSADKIQELEFKESQNSIAEEAVSDTTGNFLWEYTVVRDTNFDLPACQVYKLDYKLSFQKARQSGSVNLQTYLKNQ